MPATYWFKQSAGQPLFPELLWARPENKRQAGKLLIIGGNKYGFSAPAGAYQASLTAGIGVAKVLLPDDLQKTVGTHHEAAEFAPTTPSGSFSHQALGSLLDLAQWADGVLLAGDIGRNSETAILMENFFQRYSGQLTLANDAVEYAYPLANGLLKRPETTFVLSLPQLQKLIKESHSDKAVTTSMDLLQLIEFLHHFTKLHSANIMVTHQSNMFVAAGGKVSTTKLAELKPNWQVDTAAAASVWWLQHQGKSFEALTTSLVH